TRSHTVHLLLQVLCSFTWNSSVVLGKNVALQGRATQISLHGNGFASNAIDGNKDGVYGHGSCTHTVNDLNPWWRLDLLKRHKVFSVVITNTVDSVPERLNGAEIRIGNSLDNNGNNNPRCAVISSIHPGFSTTFECDGMEGHYINVVIPGRQEYLTLCEVEVLPPNQNLALYGKATQSDLVENPWSADGLASNAIDGNHDSHYDHGSCTATTMQNDPWWRLDLLDKYVVTSITITNRKDCCPERLDGAEIHIGNSLLNNEQCDEVTYTRSHTISSIPGGRSLTFKWKKGIPGRYINVVIPGSNRLLTLCEVESYISFLD
uniref:Uncharacterized LOC107719123 n=1 Tax=Sinocyclocheilus rhinocerous TaxID=307959 RepID=A0A673MJ18_9TELE